MRIVEFSEADLKAAARRTYERGRWQGGLVRGVGAAILAMPSLLVCNRSPWAGACLAGFGLVVAAGLIRGGTYEEGTRAGALAGILPCLLPAAVSIFDPMFCRTLLDQGLWLCGLGGIAAGVILGLWTRPSRALSFWASAFAAFGFAASLGCLPAGAVGFAGLALGVLVGALPVLASRKVFA
jgi:hypothetical protein